jgi:hypothetical protein
MYFVLAEAEQEVLVAATPITTLVAEVADIPQLSMACLLTAE